MTTRMDLVKLLVDNGIDPTSLPEHELAILEGDENDPSTAVILEMNSRINALERQVHDLSNPIEAIIRRMK